MLLKTKKDKPQEAMTQIYQTRQTMQMELSRRCTGSEIDKFYLQALHLLDALIELFQEYNYKPYHNIRSE